MLWSRLLNDMFRRARTFDALGTPLHFVKYIRKVKLTEIGTHRSDKTPQLFSTRATDLAVRLSMNGCSKRRASCDIAANLWLEKKCVDDIAYALSIR